MLLLLAACAEHTSRPVEVDPIDRMARTVTSCADFGTHPDVTALIGTLGRLRTVTPPVFPGYDPLNAWLLVTGSIGADSCGLLWHGGRTVAVGSVPAPKLVTPAFGHALGATGNAPTWTSALLSASAQPAGLTDWLKAHGTESAVIIPLDAQKTAADRVYFALHEGFHVHVQAPTWLRQASAPPWPSWDVTPSRATTVASCYGSAADVEPERLALRSATMSGVNRESRRIVCAHLTSFAKARAARRASRPASCAEAEDILELEEGTADFVAWKTELALGVMDTATLQSRLDAPLTDPSYVLGAGQVFVLDALDRLRPAMDRIPTSASPGAGGLFAESRNALAERCAQDD